MDQVGKVELEPIGQKLPGGHKLGVTVPRLQKYPAGHVKHTVAPVVFINVPAEHETGSANYLVRCNRKWGRERTDRSRRTEVTDRALISGQAIKRC